MYDNILWVVEVLVSKKEKKRNYEINKIKQK